MVLNLKDFEFSKITQETVEKEPELLENSNEAIQVRGYTKIEIKSAEHFHRVMQEEEEFRNQLDNRVKISSKKYHTLYILQMKHKMSA